MSERDKIFEQCIAIANAEAEAGCQVAAKYLCREMPVPGDITSWIATASRISGKLRELKDLL